mgnify:CR=1 FL=1
MILSGHDRYWKQPDPYHRNYACVEYAAMGAAWLKAEGIYPVHIVSMQNHDQSWGHTLCEVPSLGTYDFHANIFFPDYYYHQGPVTNEQVEKSTQACAWTTHRDYNCIDIYYKYHPQEVRALEMSQVVLRQTKYFNGC